MSHYHFSSRYRRPAVHWMAGLCILVGLAACGASDQGAVRPILCAGVREMPSLDETTNTSPFVLVELPLAS